MILYIKNMVCDRCTMVIRQQLEHLNFTVTDAVLGQVTIAETPTEQQLSQIRSALKLTGFELIDEKRNQLVERIKNVIIELVHHTDPEEININYSQLISSKLNRDYTYLSSLFSEMEDVTIEKYIIQQKIEKVKELMEYGDLNLNEIAYKLGYSSSAHLSAQFKKTTGITPTQYRSEKPFKRSPLDKL